MRIYKPLRTLAAAAAAALLCTTIGACNNSLGGFSGFVGNTPPVPPVTSFKVLGIVGTPFTLQISNANASWLVKGAIPLNVLIVNNQTPARMIATKLSNNNNLMSVQIVNAGTVLSLASTTAPFGVASVQTGAALLTMSPPAAVDVRIYVTGPFGQRFQSLVEDGTVGFITNTRAPAVFLFDNPAGKIDGQFTQDQNFGSFTINLTQGGNGANVVTTASGGPFVVIRQP
ncbi:MAG: hypothetical protein ACLQDV_02295 [Candidatus Binataceae bacterium]